MYCTALCSYCVAAERLLSARGAGEIEKLRVDLHPELFAEMLERTRRRTVPQVFVGGIHVGGYNDLVLWDREGRLAPLLDA